MGMFARAIAQFEAAVVGKQAEAATFKAADVEKKAIAEAIQSIEGRVDQSLGLLDPFAQAGTGALEGLQQGATLGGLSQNFQDITQSDIFNPLVAQRQRGADAAFAQAGLTRSGGAIREAAQIPTDVAFDIEALLSGRQQNLAGIGLGAAQGQAGFLGQAGTNVAQLQVGSGQAQSSALLANAQRAVAQANAQLQQAQQQSSGGRFSNLLGTATALAPLAPLLPGGGVVPFLQGLG